MAMLEKAALDAAHIAKTLAEHGSKAADMLFERIQREEKLRKYEAIMLSDAAMLIYRKQYK